MALSKSVICGVLLCVLTLRLSRSICSFGSPERVTHNRQWSQDQLWFSVELTLCIIYIHISRLGWKLDPIPHDNVSSPFAFWSPLTNDNPFYLTAFLSSKCILTEQSLNRYVHFSLICFVLFLQIQFKYNGDKGTP